MLMMIFFIKKQMQELQYTAIFMYSMILAACCIYKSKTNGHTMNIKKPWLKLNYLMYQTLIQHKLRNFSISLLKSVSTILTCVIFLVSLTTCLIVLTHTLYQEISVITYYKSKHIFPSLYILSGTLKFLNQKDDISNKSIDVLIGGYKTKVNSSKFSLVFLSAQDKDIPVVIRVEIDGKIKQFIRYINKQDNKHYIREEFVIDARRL